MTKNYDDINQQLAEMMMKEKREAFDAGALAIMDSIIELCKMSGNRLNLRNLYDYKLYVTRGLERINGEKEGSVQHKEADPPVRLVARRVDPEVVVIAGAESSVGSDSPTEEAQPPAGQGGEAVTQAESS